MFFYFIFTFPGYNKAMLRYIFTLFLITQVSCPFVLIVPSSSTSFCRVNQLFFLAFSIESGTKELRWNISKKMCVQHEKMLFFFSLFLQRRYNDVKKQNVTKCWPFHSSRHVGGGNLGNKMCCDIISLYRCDGLLLPARPFVSFFFVWTAAAAGQQGGRNQVKANRF